MNSEGIAFMPSDAAIGGGGFTVDSEGF